MKKKLKSLSIFFPFLNDEGTVEKQISEAYLYGKKAAGDLEVIAIHGGASTDNTLKKIKEQKKIHPDLMVIDKSDNKQGYAVIKHGFKAASKDWIFYTDGDAQYHLTDLEKLIDKQFETNADVVNGYKVSRQDPPIRLIFGEIYRNLTRLIFALPIEDIDCDFRLIRRNLFSKITLESGDASILPELIKKLDRAGAVFAEVPVNHYKRIHGQSNYNTLSLIIEKTRGDIGLLFRLLKKP